MKNFLSISPFWIRPPKVWARDGDSIFITTDPNTDLWQRTYYGFQNDNAPIFQAESEELFFSFSVKTQFDTKRRFDQCGVVVYLDSENWLKASVEYENEQFQRLGSVVTNQGFSDWATTDISTDINEIWYRLSRREDDFCIEYSLDGCEYRQMRICHLVAGSATIRFGIYACSPENSSFQAKFYELNVTECQWHEHQLGAGG